MYIILNAKLYILIVFCLSNFFSHFWHYFQDIFSSIYMQKYLTPFTVIQ